MQSISFSPVVDMIAAGSRCSNANIHLLDTVTVAVKRSLTVDSGFLGVQSISVSPKGLGEMIATGCDDGTIHLVDVLTAEVKRSVTVDSGFRGVQSVSFSPMGDMIAAGCYNGKIQFVTKHVNFLILTPCYLKFG